MVGWVVWFVGGPYVIQIMQWHVIYFYFFILNLSSITDKRIYVCMWTHEYEPICTMPPSSTRSNDQKKKKKN